MELKTFAVAVYSAAGITDACLTLQDDHDVDVPLLLFCGWHGVYFGALPAEQLARATDISQTLGSHLIRPLRQTRRWMKTHGVPAASETRWNALREDIKRAELNAELLMLDTLAAMVTGGTDACHHTTRSADIRHNLNLLLTPDARVPGNADQLLQLIAAACEAAALPVK